MYNLFLMVSLSFILLLFGIIFHRDNFIVICMILELIYLLLGYYLVSIYMENFVIIFLGITGAESAIGLSLLLSYYLSVR